MLLPVGVTVDLEISPCAINAWLKLTFILCFICKIHTVNRVYQRYYTYHQRDDLEDFNHVFISLYKWIYLYIMYSIENIKEGGERAKERKKKVIEMKRKEREISNNVIMFNRWLYYMNIFYSFLLIEFIKLC